mgnify:CR=1 FL=1
MFDRLPNTQRVSWFLDQYDSGRLILDPPYQRRSVWNDEYRNYFIDSVMRNYPTQAIFLEVETPPKQRTRYKVLDGKQRLTTLISFCADEFEVPSTLSDMKIAGLYFSDLPAALSSRVLEYILTVETIGRSTTADLEMVFDRLNRNTLKLNAQELRNARFSGKFASRMEELADDPVWKRIGFATDSNIRRMRDVEYVSEFYVVCLAGIQDGKDYLDRFYAKNDDGIEGQREADQSFAEAVRYLNDLLDVFDLKQTRFRKISDFYSLWAALVGLQKKGMLAPPIHVAEKLREFDVDTARPATERSNLSSKYLENVQQGTNKGPRRAARAEILEQVMTSDE